MKRRLFVDPKEETAEISPKKSRVDPVVRIEEEILKIRKMKDDIQKRKLHGKRRSAGSPRDKTSFRPLRPKIELLSVSFRDNSFFIGDHKS